MSPTQVILNQAKYWLAVAPTTCRRDGAHVIALLPLSLGAHVIRLSEIFYSRQAAEEAWHSGFPVAQDHETVEVASELAELCHDLAELRR